MTHVLIDKLAKTQPRANWEISSPSDPSLNSKVITDKFFAARAPHASLVPKIDFKPAPSRTRTTGPDSTWGTFTKYGLPSELEVEMVVSGQSPGSGAFKVTQDELVERLLDGKGDVGGARSAEAEARVKDIVQRNCKTDAEGYLNWVG